jgi:hypothetical protein
LLGLSFPADLTIVIHISNVPAFLVAEFDPHLIPLVPDFVNPNDAIAVRADLDVDQISYNVRSAVELAGEREDKRRN